MNDQGTYFKDQHLLYQRAMTAVRSTIFKLRVVVVVQPQLQVLYMLATHPSSQDYEHASGSSNKDDDVLGHVDNHG